MPNSNPVSCIALLEQIVSMLSHLGFTVLEFKDDIATVKDTLLAKLSFLGSTISMCADDKSFDCAIVFSQEPLIGDDGLSEADKESIDRSVEIMVRNHYDMDRTIEAEELSKTNSDLVALSVLAAVSIYAQVRLSDRLALKPKKQVAV